MNTVLEEINDLIARIPVIVQHAEENKTKETYEEFQQFMPKIQKVITSLLENIPKYREMGVDLPEDIILTQLSNLLMAIEHRDIILLSDTLQYEIINTIQVYKEILEEIEKQ